MKVLLVSEPGENGVFRYVESLAHYLAGEGIEVHLAYSDRRSGRQLPRLLDFIRRRRGETLNLATGNRPALADLRALGALLRFARRIRPDIIHSHSSKAGALARVLPFFGIRARHVYHPHSYAGMQPWLGPARLLYNGIESLLGRCGVTVNVSQDEQIHACGRLRVPARHLVGIPNGVDTAAFRPADPARKSILRRSLGLPGDALVLGSVGRASAQKDPWTLYRAFAAAAARDPALVLLHLGSGELERELDEFVVAQGLQSRIRRRAFLDQPADFYQALDGFILTSCYEGLSLAVLETLSCNLPLILSRAPGNRFLARLPLSHLQTAAVGDVPGFATAIGRWAATCRDRTGVACNHRRIAQALFDHRDNLAEVLQLYRRLLRVDDPRPSGGAADTRPARWWRIRARRTPASRPTD